MNELAEYRDEDGDGAPVRLRVIEVMRPTHPDALPVVFAIDEDGRGGFYPLHTIFFDLGPDAFPARG